MILNDADSVLYNGQEAEIWLGGTPPVKVWPSRNVVDIALGVGFAARDQFRAALTARGLDYTTITEVPFEINLTGTGTTQNMFYGCASLMSAPDMDTSSVTDMRYMFFNCTSLTHVPDLDTSQVTNMRSMFSVCSSLTHVPDLDTSQVTNMDSMFFNCSSLTHVPDLDTSQVTNMSTMFYNCTSLTDGNVRLIGRHPQVNFTSMIAGSGLTREPFYNAAGNPI